MSNDLVNINGKAVERMVYKGMPVVTFRMVDELHERAEGTAGRNFRENKQYLVEGEDFFRVPKSELSIDEFRRLSDEFAPASGKGGKDTILLTETGYLMLVKSLTDPLAWKVQRMLVSRYFATKHLAEKETPRHDPSKIIPHLPKSMQAEAGLLTLKHYFGVPVDHMIAKVQNSPLATLPEDPDANDRVVHCLELLLADDNTSRFPVKRGKTAEGLTYLQAAPGQFVEVFAELCKEHDLPEFPYSSFQLTKLTTDSGLLKLGWQREKLEKKIRHRDHYRYTKVTGGAV